MLRSHDRKTGTKSSSDRFKPCGLEINLFTSCLQGRLLGFAIHKSKSLESSSLGSSQLAKFRSGFCCAQMPTTIPTNFSIVIPPDYNRLLGGCLGYGADLYESVLTQFRPLLSGVVSGRIR